jgi:hypothetical protein
LKKKPKNNLFAKPVFKVLAFLIFLFSILIIIESNKKKEIDTHGINNTGLVNFCEYVSYIDNAKSQKRISFYRIRVDYEYNGSNYSATIELQPQEYKEQIGKKLNKGDKISIRHSIKNPNNFIIK